MPKRRRFGPKSLTNLDTGQANLDGDLIVAGDALIGQDLTVLGDIQFSDGTYAAPGLHPASTTARGIYYSPSETAIGIPENCALSVIKADGNYSPNALATSGELRRVQLAALTDGGTPYSQFLAFESNSNGQAGLVLNAFGTNNYYVQSAGTYLDISMSSDINLRTDSENPATVQADVNKQILRLDGTNMTHGIRGTLVFNDPFYLQDYTPGITTRRMYTTDGIDLYWRGLKLNTDEVASGGTATLTTEDIYRVTVTTSTITLPLAASNPGKEITIVNIGAWTDTSIAAAGANYIDVTGTTSITLNGDHVHVTLKSDGTNDWMII